MPNNKRKLERFERNKAYRAIKDFVVDQSPKVHMMGVCYEINEGDIFRFRGKNIGYAEFINGEGKILFLKPKTAFKIFDKIS